MGAAVVYTIQDLSPSSDTKDYEQTITQAVSAAFSAQGYALVPEDTWRKNMPSGALASNAMLRETEALAVAQTLSAALAVTGCYSVRNDEIFYSIQCWDVAGRKLLSGVEQTTPFNLAFFSALSEKLSADLLPKRGAVAAQESAPSVVFTSSMDGMEVLLSQQMYVGRITQGRVTWPVAEPITAGAPPVKVVVEKRKAGYHAAQETVRLYTDKDVKLAPLAKEHAAEIELDWTVGQLLGLGATIRGFGVPDWDFGYVSSYLWAQPPAVLAPRAVIHADLSMGFGSYFLLPPGAPVRLGLSSGIGFTASALTTPGFPYYADFYLNVISWWIETGFEKTNFFLKQDYRYDLGNGANLLGRGWILGNFPPTTIGVMVRW
jgi:hypothetical protein